MVDLLEVGMQDCKPLGIPMDPKVRLESAPEDYIQGVVCTSSWLIDVHYAWDRYRLCQPTDKHLLAAKRVLRYLYSATSVDFRISFWCTGEIYGL